MGIDNDDLQLYEGTLTLRMYLPAIGQHSMTRVVPCMHILFNMIGAVFIGFASVKLSEAFN